MTTASPRPRYTGLDGLRAVAVTLVILFHLFPAGWLRSGYIGVDVFFVISGFLITSLLLRERDETGRIRLSTFWARRARRLLPALALMVTVCASAAWVVGGDVLLDLGRQVLGAATFSSNWVSIAAGADYFSAAQPELFRNLWSLAVEEQFYLVWPLLLPLLLGLRSSRVRAVVVLGAAAASAAWAVWLTADGGATRAYYGTDAHAFGLLAGVALALALAGPLAAPRPWMRRLPVRIGVAAAGALALVALVLVAGWHDTAAATVPVALIVTTLLSVVLVAAGTWPGAGFGRVLDVAPMRVVGERSYALYLWHWPVLVLLAAATGTSADIPVWVGVVALLITVAAAEVSFRFVETPIRRLGFRAASAQVWAAVRGSARGRVRALGATAVSLALLGGTTAAIAAAPDMSSGEAVVTAGRDALAEQPSPTPSETPDHTPAPIATAPEPVDGSQITAVGDSVMLASAPVLLEWFPGIDVDAAVSRSMYAAPDILRGLAAEGRLRPYVVLALGTNGAISRDTLAEVRQIIGTGRHLVLVSAFAPRSWIDGVNAELSAFARAHHGVQVADWAGAIAGHQELLAGDQVHPGEAGGEIFAATLADALQRAQESDARLDEIVHRLTGPVDAG